MRELGQQQNNIRCVQRLGRRGLSSACIEGILASSAPFIAVMDADMQHDETLLPRMLAMLKEQQLDVVVGIRYGTNGSVGDLQSCRVVISKLASRLARLVVKAESTDPLSGFFRHRPHRFCCNHARFIRARLQDPARHFASSPRPLAFAELPFHFRRRVNGESKLDTLVAREYLALLLDKLAARRHRGCVELRHVVGLCLAIARARATSSGPSSGHHGRAERRRSKLVEPLRSLREPGRVHSRSPSAAAACYGRSRSNRWIE